MSRYTARVRCAVVKELTIEAHSLDEAKAKAKEWDCIEEIETDFLDFEVVSVREERD